MKATHGRIIEIAVLVVGLVGLPAIAAAGLAESGTQGRLDPGFLWPQGSIEEMLDELATRSSADDAALGMFQTETAPGYPPGYRSPAKAFFFSLLVPGVGEWYSGARYRGLAFLGLEALSWGGYIYYDGKGEDERDRYEAFADTHYDAARYRDVVNEICGKYENWPGEPGWPCVDCENFSCGEGTSAADSNNCSAIRGHFNLPEEKGQHYYEDAGKYDKFIFGWDDWYENYNPRRDQIGWFEWEPGDPWPFNVDPWAAVIGLTSNHREEYREMRRQSNNYFDRATQFTWLIVVNHVASALDAAMAARSHNRLLSGEPEGFDVGMETRPLDRDLETRFFVRKWF